MAAEEKSVSKSMAETLQAVMRKSNQTKKEKTESPPVLEQPKEQIKEPEPVKKDTVIKKTTETIIVQNDKYNCELIKNTIIGNVTGTREEIDSITIKSEDKTVLRFKTKEEAGQFLNLCQMLSNQLQNNHVPLSSSSINPQEQQFIQQELGQAKVELLHTPEGVVEVRTEPVGTASRRSEYDETVNLLSKLGAGGFPSAPQPSLSESNHKLVFKDEAFHNSAMSGPGLTEDQLNPEQRKFVEQYHKLMGVENPTNNVPSDRVGPSLLKTQREKKRLGRP